MVMVIGFLLSPHLLFPARIAQQEGPMKALFCRLALIATFFIATSPASSALYQSNQPVAAPQSIAAVLAELVQTPAVSGYEQSVGKIIVARLKAMPQHYAAKVDNL